MTEDPKSTLDRIEADIAEKSANYEAWNFFFPHRCYDHCDAEEHYWTVCEEIIKYTYRLALDVRRLYSGDDVYVQKDVDSAEENKAQLLRGVKLLEFLHENCMEPFHRKDKSQ